MTSSKAAKIFLDKKKWNMVLKWNRKHMILGTGSLYEIKVDVRLSHMKSFYAKWKFHDYTKIKLWNDFDLKLCDCRTGLRNFLVTLNIQVSNRLQWMEKIWDKWKTERRHYFKSVKVTKKTILIGFGWKENS